MRLLASLLAVCLIPLSFAPGCSGTRQGNPGGARTSTLQLEVGAIQHASISQLSMCFSDLRLYPSQSTTPVPLAIAATEVSASAASVSLTQAEVPSGTYSRLEADLKTSCASGKSMLVSNGNGTFSSTETITLKFNGVVALQAGSTHSVKIEAQPIADELPAVANDSAVKSTSEATAGDILAGGGSGGASALYSEAVLSDAPAGYWRLNEPVGTAASVTAIQDVSGANLCEGAPCHLSVQSGSYLPTFGEAGASADTGTSILFSGAHVNFSKPVLGQYPYVTIFNFNDGVSTDYPFSVEAVIKTSASNINGVIAGAYHSSGSRSWKFGVDASNRLYVRLIHRDNESIYIGRRYSTPLSANTWHHVTMTYDGSKSSSGIRLYLNGVRVDDTNDQNGAYTGFRRTYTSFTIGDTSSGWTDLNDGFGGWIDEVSIFPGVLPASRVQSHYQAL